MKITQKKLTWLILIVLVLNVLIIGGWLLYSWASSLNMSTYDIIMVMGSIFIVVDTMEIILLRHGQKAWTHHPGKTIVKAIESGYDELQKSPKAQEAFMVLSQNAFQAGFEGIEGNPDVAGKVAKTRRLVLPPQLKQYEDFVNQPFIKDQVVESLQKAKNAQKTQGDKPQKDDW